VVRAGGGYSAGTGTSRTGATHIDHDRDRDRNYDYDEDSWGCEPGRMTPTMRTSGGLTRRPPPPIATAISSPSPTLARSESAPTAPMTQKIPTAVPTLSTSFSNDDGGRDLGLGMFAITPTAVSAGADHGAYSAYGDYGAYDADGDGNLVNCLGGLEFDDDDHLEMVGTLCIDRQCIHGTLVLVHCMSCIMYTDMYCIP
jgi:hypothetical protein